MSIRILSVARGSMAARAGIQPGETLLKINGEDVIDEIDYQALSMSSRLKVELADAEGQTRVLSLHKGVSAPLGLKLDERAILEPRPCKNHCIFCFVDQMPKGMRSTLYVKDDDWRLSLMMGNFVTLTNVDDQEFERILRRKASPLYISVHATDPATRVRILKNPTAGNLLPRLQRMAENGLKFHCQVVLCPGENDGPILHQTIVDLANLYPAAQSLAIVPIGLTDHRDRLYPLRLFREEEAQELVRDFELIQAYYLKTLGTRFIFPADEFYSIAHLPVPSEEAYEGYPQIENGIGMLRLLAQECENALPLVQSLSPAPPPRHLLIPTGVSALPYIQDLAERFAPAGTSVDVFAVPNQFFGPSVTVTGLITGQDLMDALADKKADQVLISSSMLRENEDSFLDDFTVPQLQALTGLPFRVVQNRGEDFVRALYGI
ncbi:MAG: DUF512 domain-containing protein [Clostridia bacterium]|nr:DUF512 domain-containing protein [Clostridia bacterium]